MPAIGKRENREDRRDAGLWLAGVHRKVSSKIQRATQVVDRVSASGQIRSARTQAPAYPGTTRNNSPRRDNLKSQSRPGSSRANGREDAVSVVAGRRLQHASGIADNDSGAAQRRPDLLRSSPNRGSSGSRGSAINQSEWALEWHFATETVEIFLTSGSSREQPGPRAEPKSRKNGIVALPRSSCTSSLQLNEGGFPGPDPGRDRLEYPGWVRLNQPHARVLPRGGSWLSIALLGDRDGTRLVWSGPGRQAVEALSSSRSSRTNLDFPTVGERSE